MSKTAIKIVDPILKKVFIFAIVIYIVLTLITAIMQAVNFDGPSSNTFRSAKVFADAIIIPSMAGMLIYMNGGLKGLRREVSTITESPGAKPNAYY